MGRRKTICRCSPRCVASVWASPNNVAGRAYIDALVAAGFDKSAMQVTKDKSTVGNPAESIQFSVHWGGDCLVGQVGPATGAPVTVVAARPRGRRHASSGRRVPSTGDGCSGAAARAGACGGR